MDFGTYTIAALRQIIRERLDPVEATYRPMPASEKTADYGDQSKIDQAVFATYKAAGQSGATATMTADLAHSGGFPAFLPASWTKNWPSLKWPKTVVECGQKELDPSDPSHQATGEQKQTVRRKVTMWNHLLPSFYNRIDVEDTFELRQKTDETLVKSWTEEKHWSVYKYREIVDASEEVKTRPGEDWWPTYRYELEEFVNRVKGRPTAVWMDFDDSIEQMETIDRTYEKIGLGTRPSSKFNL